MLSKCNREDSMSDENNMDCECFPRDNNGKPLQDAWYKKPTHISIRGWKKRFARCVLISTLDYVYSEHPEVICNGCNIDMKPNNCYIVEYSDDKKNWEPYDVYCFDCVEKYFSKAEKETDWGIEN